MPDAPRTAKVIADIIDRMETEPLQWYRQNVGMLAQMMSTSYESAHRLIMQMKNQTINNSY